MKINSSALYKGPPLHELSQMKEQRSQVNIEQTKPEINIQKDQVAVNIDRTPFEYDLGYRRDVAKTKETAQESLAHAKEVIAQYAQEGKMLMDFMNFDIADLARQNTGFFEEVEVNLVYVREPEISVELGGLNIDVTV